MGKRKPDMPGEAPFEERINGAILAYKTAVTIYNKAGETGDEPSVRRIAYAFNLCDTTLLRRLTGKTRGYSSAHEEQQRLTPSEEKALVSMILQLEEWGWSGLPCTRYGP